MKTKSINMQSPAPTVDRAALILQEQLALRRLKELAPELELVSERNRNLKRLLKASTSMLSSVYVALFRAPRIERHVGPGLVPVEWHANERFRQLRAMKML